MTRKETNGNEMKRKETEQKETKGNKNFKNPSTNLSKGALFKQGFKTSRFTIDAFGEARFGPVFKTVFESVGVHGRRHPRVIAQLHRRSLPNPQQRREDEQRHGPQSHNHLPTKHSLSLLVTDNSSKCPRFTIIV